MRNDQALNECSSLGLQRGKDWSEENVGCRIGKLNDLLEGRWGKKNIKHLAMLGLHIYKHI